MDDYLEIDLRKIIKNVLSKWYWVILPAVLIGIALFLYSFLLVPDIFQANAAVIITDPRNIRAISFDENYQMPQLSASAVKWLAKSDEVLVQLLAMWKFNEKEEITITDLDKILSIEAADKETIFVLSGDFKDAPAVASLVNIWADLVIKKFNSEYFNFDENMIEKYGKELLVAKKEMEEAESAIVDFIETDPRALLNERLSSLKAEQSRNFLKQRQLRYTKFDSEAILRQIEVEADSARLDNTFRIFFLLVQSRLYSGGFDISFESSLDGMTLPSFDLFNQDLEYMTVGRFRAIIEKSISVIDEQIAQLENEEELYISEINQIESSIRSLNFQKSLLDKDFNTAEGVYNKLLNVYPDIFLTMNLMGEGYVKLASAAAVPEESLPHHSARNALIGGVVGGLLGLAGVMIADWWKQSDVDLQRP
jgi:uncharacterized protein involved in exopolysaccharide biosynthesis